MQGSCMEGETHARFMHGRGDPCKVHAWKGRPMQGSCMEGDIHARFMDGRGHPCKVHAWSGRLIETHACIMHDMCMIHAFMHEIC